MSASIQRTIITLVTKKSLHKIYVGVTMKKLIHLIKTIPHSAIIIHVDYTDDGVNEYRGTSDKEAIKAFEAFLE